MKTLFTIIIFGTISLSAEYPSWSEECRRVEAKQVALWESKLAEVKTKEQVVRLDELWLGLRNMGHRKSRAGYSYAVEVIYYKIQNEILSIPGHAEYFAEKLAEARRNAQHPWLDDTYHRQYWIIRDTMSHLPSPEAILVLGRMLESNEDARSKEKVSKFLEEIRDTDGYFELYNPPTFAISVITKLNLRELPDLPEGYINYTEQLNSYRSWWQEIKSGLRAFSFKGQSVEYRFKPDGSWETIPIPDVPDDGPKTVVLDESSPLETRTGVSSDKIVSNKQRMPSWIFALVVFGGLGILYGVLMRLRRKNAM